MAGTLSLAGTFTPIASDIAKIARTTHNDPRFEGINVNDIKNVPDEIRQFVQIVADGLNIPHWVAATLTRTWLTAYINTQTPKQV